MALKSALKPFKRHTRAILVGLSLGLFHCVVRIHHLPQNSQQSSVAPGHPTDETQWLQKIHLAENRLMTKVAWLQYARALPYFESLAEQLEFLQLPDVEARQKWLEQKNFWQRAQKTPPHFLALIRQNAIAKDMLPDDVLKAWGPPDEIHTSGFSGMGNMVWVWHVDQLTPKGAIRQVRQVHFQNGRVVGWDQWSYP